MYHVIIIAVAHVPTLVGTGEMLVKMPLNKKLICKENKWNMFI